MSPHDDERMFAQGREIACRAQLRAFSKPANLLLNDLSEPMLPEREFMAKIADYNEKHKDDAPAVGPCSEFVFAAAPKRSVRVKMYTDDGRVVLEGIMQK